MRKPKRVPKVSSPIDIVGLRLRDSSSERVVQSDNTCNPDA